MNIIEKTLRKVILKERMKICEFRQKLMENNISRYQRNIVSMMKKRGDRFKIGRLESKRDELYAKCLKLITKKYDLFDQFMGLK